MMVHRMASMLSPPKKPKTIPSEHKTMARIAVGILHRSE